MLRAIAGFHPLEGGEILLNGDLVSRRGSTLPPEKRHLGMVFQDYALFPHLDVASNIGFRSARCIGGGETAQRR